MDGRSDNCISEKPPCVGVCPFRRLSQSVKRFDPDNVSSRLDSFAFFIHEEENR